MPGITFETKRSQPVAPATVDQPMEILKPFMLLACAAFTVGFMGYWALVGVLAPAGGQADTLWPAQVAAPITPDLASARHV